MKLIIAEKPSVGKEIAHIVGANQSHEGYLEGNGYICSWCYGHLLGLYDGKDYYFSKKYKMHIVDRVGGGDSFGGGLICACLNEYGPQETIEFAVAASCLKHSIEGDYNMVSMDEVLKLAGGDGSGRVQR